MFTIFKKILSIAAYQYLILLYLGTTACSPNNIKNHSIDYSIEKSKTKFIKQLNGYYINEFPNQKNSAQFHFFKKTLISTDQFILHCLFNSQTGALITSPIIYQMPVSFNGKPKKSFFWITDDKLINKKNFSCEVNNIDQLLAILDTLPRCYVSWEHKNNQFIGKTVKEHCEVTYNNINYKLAQTIIVNPNNIELNKNIYDQQNNIISLNNNKTTLIKTNIYKGWIGFANESNQSEKDWFIKKDIILHEHGSELLIENPYNNKETIIIKLTNKHYAKSNLDLLLLSIVKNNSVIASAWANQNATELGIHLNWLQIGLSKQ